MSSLQFAFGYITVATYIGVFSHQGCSLQGHQLMENQLDSPSVIAMPTCTVAWVTKDTPPPYPEAQCISLPIYSSSDRDKLVACLDVPCGGSNVHWVQLCGAALFLKN